VIVDDRLELLQGEIKVVLGAVGESGAIDGDGRLAAGLAQNVDDALVRRG
jgi:hypothetical protein